VRKATGVTRVREWRDGVQRLAYLFSLYRISRRRRSSTMGSVSRKLGTVVTTRILSGKQ